MSVTPITGIALNLGQMLGVPLAEKYGPRVVLFGSILIITSAVCTSYFASSYPLFVALYGIINGFATGMAYMVPVVCGWKYFPNNKGIFLTKKHLKNV